MRYVVLSAACFLALGVAPVWGDGGKPDISGTWRLDPAKSETHAPGTAGMTMSIEQKGNAFHFAKTFQTADGKEAKTEFKCSTDGKECDAGGVKISLWYNGPVLVEMDAGADVISKSSMKLSEDKKSMSVEIEHIVPQADTDKVVLAKVE